MLALWIATVSLMRFSGGMLGVTVVVDVPRPHTAVVNVSIAGRPFIVNGRAETRGGGDVRMDDYTNARLRARGVAIQSLDVQDDCIRVYARIPLLGTRQVTLRRE